MDDLFFPDRVDLEREYSPSSVAEDFHASVAAYRSRSDEALKSLAWERIRYGAADDEFVTLSGDFESARHIHLFIHGGYWQELSWRDALFPAPGLIDQGLVYGAINYSLAPIISLERIVDQCRDAIVAVITAAKLKGLEPTISLSGSSAGAHLAAMMSQTDWSAHGLRRNPIAGLILLSGVYLLRPLIDTTINIALGLDADRADRLSPLLLPAPPNCPTLIAWGEYETSAFKRQSGIFADHLRAARCPVESIEISGRSHFDIVFDLSDPSTSLGGATQRTLQAITPQR